MLTEKLADDNQHAKVRPQPGNSLYAIASPLCRQGRKVIGKQTKRIPFLITAVWASNWQGSATLCLESTIERPLIEANLSQARERVLHLRTRHRKVRHDRLKVIFIVVFGVFCMKRARDECHRDSGQVNVHRHNTRQRERRLILTYFFSTRKELPVECGEVR